MDNVTKEGKDCCQREYLAKENDISKLNNQLHIILKDIRFLTKEDVISQSLIMPPPRSMVARECLLLVSLLVLQSRGQLLEHLILFGRIAVVGGLQSLIYCIVL